MRLKTLSIGLVAALLANTNAEARDAKELGCIEKLFTDEQSIAMAQTGSGDAELAKKAEAKMDWIMLGMASRGCATRGKWSDNEYYNSIGYMMAWPTARGLFLLSERQGYAAIDRAFALQEERLVKLSRLSEADIDALLQAASSDGLAVADSDAARKDVRRYADVVQQTAAMRSDFAGNRPPRSLKNKR
jgi:hypothetical protein